MGRRTSRDHPLRAHIAAAAARLMAEDGIDDFGKAKRKAARTLGAGERDGLPDNAEVEAALRSYRALYQPEAHTAHLRHLRETAARVMRALAPYAPYLVGPVLSGTAGRHAQIDLQLFPASAKEVELRLLDLGVVYTVSELRRHAGDSARTAVQLSATWDGLTINLQIFDPRDERIVLRTSASGRRIERARLGEVEALISQSPA